MPCILLFSSPWTTQKADMQNGILHKKSATCCLCRQFTMAREQMWGPLRVLLWWSRSGTLILLTLWWGEMTGHLALVSVVLMGHSTLVMHVTRDTALGYKVMRGHRDGNHMTLWQSIRKQFWLQWGLSYVRHLVWQRVALVHELILSQSQLLSPWTAEGVAELGCSSNMRQCW